jgi:aminomethyltransferase
VSETDPNTNPSPPLLTTALNAWHRAQGAQMVEFAGYDMPVQYPTGVKSEHLWTRANCGLFDVSHMGPALFRFRPGAGTGDPARDFDTLARRAEAVIPSDIAGLKPGRLRYSVLLTDEGGIADDLFVGNPSVPSFAGGLWLIVNAGVKEADFARLSAIMGTDVELQRFDTNASLIALQGPDAEAVLEAEIPGVAALRFMDFARFPWLDGSVIVSRSGYTGEDGFEVLVGNNAVETFAAHMLRDARVKPIGLGARDSLRLEAGLHLYGHDMDTRHTPIEAGLAWVMQKRRREAADFAGSARILHELAHGSAQTRIGLRVEASVAAREGATILHKGETVGTVTSGGFGPSVNGPVAMGQVRADLATPGTALEVDIRGRPRPAIVTALPFIPHNYKR